MTTITDQKSLLVVMWLLTWTYAALCDHLTLTFPSWVSYLGLGIVLGAQPIALLLVAGTMVVYHWAWAQWRKPGLGDGDIDLMVQYALLFGVETTSRWLILACGLALVAHNRGNAPQAFIPWLAISAGLFWI
ncbi:hypothetical protein ACFQET_02085 [Levilactobacillus tangyuanensis]|uniref:Prepilin peptidase n=1 Tax=Levilactobacillus tangyuanensis TaxID=2486021 RepID=A0ABW1TM58_9LACO|nr:hypothetical protein [Levilactobacillus tangyuanensis]